MRSPAAVPGTERTCDAAPHQALRALEQRLPDASQLRGRPDLLHQANDRRLMAAMQALRDGMPQDEVVVATGYAAWFVDRLAFITGLEAELSRPASPDTLRRAKR